MLNNLKSETGYVLVSAGNAITDYEIKARYFYKTQQEARQSVKPSRVDSLVDVAKVEGYREVQEYFNSSDTVEMTAYLQEHCLITEEVAKGFDYLYIESDIAYCTRDAINSIEGLKADIFNEKDVRVIWEVKND